MCAYVYVCVCVCAWVRERTEREQESKQAIAHLACISVKCTSITNVSGVDTKFDGSSTTNLNGVWPLGNWRDKDRDRDRDRDRNSDRELVIGQRISNTHRHRHKTQKHKTEKHTCIRASCGYPLLITPSLFCIQLITCM